MDTYDPQTNMLIFPLCSSLELQAFMSLNHKNLRRNLSIISGSTELVNLERNQADAETPAAPDLKHSLHHRLDARGW